MKAFANKIACDEIEDIFRSDVIFIVGPSGAGKTTLSAKLAARIMEEDKEDENSLFKFKLVGLISGKENSYISLVDSGGEVTTLTIGQYLGKIKLVDLRLTEAIFEKEDKTFMIIDFNNSIRESNEY